MRKVGRIPESVLIMYGITVALWVVNDKNRLIKQTGRMQENVIFRDFITQVEGQRTEKHFLLWDTYVRVWQNRRTSLCERLPITEEFENKPDRALLGAQAFADFWEIFEGRDS